VLEMVSPVPVVQKPHDCPGSRVESFQIAASPTCLGGRGCMLSARGITPLDLRITRQESLSGTQGYEFPGNYR
jgi:hypothetical protein